MEWEEIVSDDLIRDAVPTPIYGVTVRVASLADVIRSKQAANRPKDQRVLPTLREILALQHERESRAEAEPAAVRGNDRGRARAAG